MDYVLKGTISLVPGDNLASQYLGGYKGLASALRKCRQCMAVDDDMQSKVSKVTCSDHRKGFYDYCIYVPCTLQFVSEAFEPRSRATHDTHIASLAGPLRDHYSTTFGITRDSILNSSRSILCM